MASPDDPHAAATTPTGVATPDPRPTRRGRPRSVALLTLGAVALMVAGAVACDSSASVDGPPGTTTTTVPTTLFLDDPGTEGTLPTGPIMPAHGFKPPSTKPDTTAKKPKTTTTTEPKPPTTPKPPPPPTTAKPPTTPKPATTDKPPTTPPTTTSAPMG
jgi:hypothetical protein